MSGKCYSCAFRTLGGLASLFAGLWSSTSAQAGDAYQSYSLQVGSPISAIEHADAAIVTRVPSRGFVLESTGAEWRVERPDLPGRTFDSIPKVTASSVAAMKAYLAAKEGDTVEVFVHGTQGKGFRHLEVDKSYYGRQMELLEALWDEYGGDSAAVTKDGVSTITVIPYRGTSVSTASSGSGRPLWLQELFFSGMSGVFEGLEGAGLVTPVEAAASAVTGPVFSKTLGRPSTVGGKLGMDMQGISYWKDASGQFLNSRFTMRNTFDLLAFGKAVNLFAFDSEVQSICSLSTLQGRVLVDPNASDSSPGASSSTYACGKSAVSPIGIPVAACSSSGGDICDQTPLNEKKCASYPIMAGLSATACVGGKGSASLVKSYGSNGLALAGNIDTKMNLSAEMSVGLDVGVGKLDVASVDVVGKVDLLSYDASPYVRTTFGADSGGEYIRGDLLAPYSYEAMSGTLKLVIEWWSVVDWKWKRWVHVIEKFDAAESLSGDLTGSTRGFSTGRLGL